VTFALIFTGLVLAVFGIVFVALGVVNDRSYWSQRDPSANPAATVWRRRTRAHAWSYAVGGKRPSLRIGGMGVLLLAAGALVAVIGVLTAVL
jgi:hypothetical protein